MHSQNYELFSVVGVYFCIYLSKLTKVGLLFSQKDFYLSVIFSARYMKLLEIVYRSPYFDKFFYMRLSAIM